MAIYLIRHGEAKNYRKGQVKYPGPGLTLNGKKQTEKISKEIKDIKFKKIYCSDMTRAIETAEIINKKLKRLISYHRELAEFNKIVFENNPVDKEKYGVNLKRAKITRKFFKEIKKENDVVKNNILIVAHGNAITSIISEELGIPVTKMKMIYIENCSVTVIDNKISIYNQEFKKNHSEYHLL